MIKLMTKLMNRTYIFFEDPGHGWLRVPLKEVEPIADKISPYSYMRGKYAYLEEDCDAWTFLKYKFGISPSFGDLKAKGIIKEKYVENTAIRDYEIFHIRTEEEKALMETVITTLLSWDFKKSSKEKIKKASYEDCQNWQEYYGIKISHRR